ncbi:nucleotidyltransferase family protein [Sinomicrobium sp. M5D2P9]
MHNKLNQVEPPGARLQRVPIVSPACAMPIAPYYAKPLTVGSKLMTKQFKKKISYISNMNLRESIKYKMADFLSLCKSHNVKNLYAFGSSITDQFNEDSSDIDLLIEIDNDDPIERGEDLMNIWDKFEQFFQRKVDLLTNTSIKNPILRESIDSTKILIYDGKEQKISST